MYYNIDIKSKGSLINQIVRKVSKVTEEKLQYFINLYITDENQIIITKYIQ